MGHVHDSSDRSFLPKLFFRFGLLLFVQKSSTHSVGQAFGTKIGLLVANSFQQIPIFYHVAGVKGLWAHLVGQKRSGSTLDHDWTLQIQGEVKRGGLWLPSLVCPGSKTKNHTTNVQFSGGDVQNLFVKFFFKEILVQHHTSSR